jgi:hypothetical protein
MIDGYVRFCDGVEVSSDKSVKCLDGRAQSSLLRTRCISLVRTTTCRFGIRKGSFADRGQRLNIWISLRLKPSTQLAA